MKFSEYKYERPNLEESQAQYTSFIEQLKNAENVDTFMSIFKEVNQMRNHVTTMMVNNNIKVGDNYVILPKLKKIKMKKHRKIPEGYRITSVTVSKTPTEKYYVSFTCEYEAEEQEKKYNVNNAVGLDFSMQGLFVASDGNDGNYPNYYRKMEKKLASNKENYQNA